MEYFYAKKRDGAWVRLTAKEKQDLIDKGKRREDDFATEYEYEQMMAPAQPKEQTSVPYIKQATTKPVQATRDLYKFKKAAMEALASIYSGDAQGMINAIAEGKVPSSPLSDEQRKFYNVAKAIISEDHSVDNLEKRLAKDDSRFSKFARNLATRKTWYEGNKPSSQEVFFPNLSARQRAGRGVVSKGIGALEDVMTLPTRAASSGLTELLPQGIETTFAENMARPVELSNAPEKFFDFTLSSIAPGKLLSSAGKSVGKLTNLLKAPSFASEVANVGGPLTTSTFKDVLKGAVGGVGEGLAYSAFPAAVEATSTSDDALKNAALTLGGGVLTGGASGAVAPSMSALTSKIFGQTNPRLLTPFGEEIASGYNTAKRLEESIGRGPLKSPSEQRKTLETVGSQLDDIASIIGKRREKSIADVEAFLDPAKKTMNGVRVGVVDMVTNSLPKFIDDASKDVSTDLLDLLGKEQTRILNNIQKAESPLTQLTAEITRLRRTRGRTTDPEKALMYQQLESALHKVESPEVLGTAIDVNDFHKVINRERGKVQADLRGYLEASTAKKGLQGLEDARKDFRELYDIELPTPEVLPKIGKSRYDVSVDTKFQDYLANQGKLNAVLKKYGYEPVDYITPAVASAVRKKMKPTEAPSFDKLLSAVTSGRSLFMSPGIAITTTIAKPVSKSITSGAPTATILTGEGAVPFVFQPPIRQWESVKDMK